MILEMKRAPKTNALASPEFYDMATTIFVTLGGAALLTNWLNRDVVYYVGMGGYFVFSLLRWRKFGFGDAKISREKQEEHLDALRWRSLQAGQEFPIIEDVKKLRDVGRKIEAIKLYRQLHPEADLRAALDAVDLM